MLKANPIIINELVGGGGLGGGGGLLLKKVFFIQSSTEIIFMFFPSCFGNCVNRSSSNSVFFFISNCLYSLLSFTHFSLSSRVLVLLSCILTNYFILD